MTCPRDCDFVKSQLDFSVSLYAFESNLSPVSTLDRLFSSLSKLLEEDMKPG